MVGSPTPKKGKEGKEAKGKKNAENLFLRYLGIQDPSVTL
jgi:hypothetical protein